MVAKSCKVSDINGLQSSMKSLGWKKRNCDFDCTLWNLEHELKLVMPTFSEVKEIAKMKGREE